MKPKAAVRTAPDGRNHGRGAEAPLPGPRLGLPVCRRLLAALAIGLTWVILSLPAAGRTILGIRPSPTNSIVLSWALPADGWVLEWAKGSADVSAPWTQIPPPYHTNTTQAWFVVPAPTGSRFYRLHKQDDKPALLQVPMGMANPSFGANYFSYATVLAMARYLNTNGFAQHGYNTALLNCGCLSRDRDADGALQMGPTGNESNVTNLVADLASNGCCLGLYVQLRATDYRIDECCSMTVGPTNAYRDGYTLGKWGTRVVWDGDNADYYSMYDPDGTAFQNISEAFHAGLSDGAAAAGWPSAPVTMVSCGTAYCYPWVPKVWSLPYIRSPGGGDMCTVGISEWNSAFFEILNHYAWTITDHSSPNLFGFSLRGTSGRPWVTTNAVRTMFGISCMLNMPLFIQSPTVEPEEAVVITNDAAIAIDWDPLRSPPVVVSSNANSAVLAKALYGGDVAVGLWNLNTNEATTISVSLLQVPGILTNIVTLQDIFDAALNSASNTLSATVNAAGLNLYRLRNGQTSRAALSPVGSGFNGSDVYRSKVTHWPHG